MTDYGVLATLPADPDAFASWLRRAMARRAMSERALAAFSGLDHSTVNRILRGERHPALTTATRLAQAVVPSR